MYDDFPLPDDFDSEITFNKIFADCARSKIL